LSTAIAPTRPTPGRRNIDPIGVRRALAIPSRGTARPIGASAIGFGAGNEHCLRVVTEANGETVHNTFWDGDFEA
jgi:hypothetical protein